MKKLVSIMLSIIMLFSIAAPAYAVDNQNDADKISRADIENLFATKRSTSSFSVSSAEDEEALFLETINRIQKLYLKQEAALKAGRDVETINNEIRQLEELIDQMPHAVRLTAENVPATRGIKPTLPSESNYVSVYAYDKVGTYNGEEYDVFEIYCAAKRIGGFGNPLGYEGEVTLLTNSVWDQNQYMQKEIYARARFLASAIYPAFSIADFLVLSQMPDFFDDGATQEITAEYWIAQTVLFAYAAEKDVNWYVHVLTTEQLSHSDTIIAASLKNGITHHDSISHDQIVRASYYPSSTTSRVAANYAAQLYATEMYRDERYVGGVYYYVNNVLTATINTDTYSEITTIPGL